MLEDPGPSLRTAHEVSRTARAPPSWPQRPHRERLTVQGGPACVRRPCCPHPRCDLAKELKTIQALRTTSPSSPYASDDSLSRFIAAHYATGGAKHANAVDKRKTVVSDNSQSKCAKCGAAGCTAKSCQITPCKTCAAVIGAPAAGYCKASTRAGKEPGYCTQSFHAPPAAGKVRGRDGKPLPDDVIQLLAKSHAAGPNGKKGATRLANRPERPSGKGKGNKGNKGGGKGTKSKYHG